MLLSKMCDSGGLFFCFVHARLLSFCFLYTTFFLIPFYFRLVLYFSAVEKSDFFFLIKRICERDVCAPLFVVVIVVVILTAILTCCVDVFVFVWFDRYQSIRWNVLNFMFGRGFIFNSNLHQSIECQCKNGTNETTR